jgi:hypothetical protein
VSDDNPYSESLISTPQGPLQLSRPAFEALEGARRWASQFARWYDTEHRHSGLTFVTPDQRQRGEDIDLLAQRHALYQATRAQHPERWSGATRNWELATKVLLNPGKPLKTEPQTEVTTA